MRCVICKQGETRHGMADISLTREGRCVRICNVPADICGTCGESYHDEATTALVLKQAAQYFSRQSVEHPIAEHVFIQQAA